MILMIINRMCLCKFVYDATGVEVGADRASSEPVRRRKAQNTYIDLVEEFAVMSFLTGRVLGRVGTTQFSFVILG